MQCVWGQCRYKGKILTRQQVLKMGSLQDLPSNETRNPHIPTKRVRSSPGEQARAPRLRVFSWNCGGLSGDMYDGLLVSLGQDKVDVALIQETRWGFTSEWETQGFFCFHSGLTNNSTKQSGEAGGVLTLINKELASKSALRWCMYVPGRILHVRLPHGKIHVDVVNVYQKFCPKFWEPGPQSDICHETWLALDKSLSALPRRNILLLGGDFNAKLSPCGPHVGASVGQSGQPVDNDFLALVQKHNLCMLNSWTTASEFTSVGPQGGRAIIDYLAVRLPHADCIAKQARYMHQRELILGKQVHHVPLVTCISLHWMCWKHRSESCPPKFDKMLFWQDASCNHPRFQALMAELRRKLPGSSLETIEVLLHQLGCKHYPATSSTC